MTTIHGGVRFVPTRAGIVNLWDYRDQEFCFADGRLVLRGPNGSGKTKALEVLFPFVLDGRIEPRRLNPFAGEERTMKSNLLYRKQDSAHSYVWMEFARGRWEDPETVTVGIGMRASRSSDKVTRWYFVADGRVGVDFSLLGPDDRPFTRKQLAEQIGTDAIVDRPVDYRAAIDARMFGLGAQRYDQLINLVLTLRRPQLAKNLDPRGLSQALTDGLRPLDEQLILDAARSFSDMEEVGRTLEGLVRADTATRTFLGVYRRYLAVQARAEVDQVRARLEAVTHASTALFAATALRTRRDGERAEAEAAAEAADLACEQALADRETLQRSSAYEGKQQLDDLADAVRRLQTSADAHRHKAATAARTLEQRAEEAERARTAAAGATAALTRGEQELAAAAEEAGIGWHTPAPDARAEVVTAAIRAGAEQRDADVRAVRQAAGRLEAATGERLRAERGRDRAAGARESAAAEMAAAEAAVAVARTETAGALRSWWERHHERFAGAGEDLVDTLGAALAATGSPDSPTAAEVLTERAEPPRTALRERERDAVARAREADTEAVRLRAEREQVVAQRCDAPPSDSLRRPSPRGARVDGAASIGGTAEIGGRIPDTGRDGSSVSDHPRDDLPGAPLWRLVRFAEGLDSGRAAGVEAALQAAGLLDAWVCPEAAIPADPRGDRVLAALPSGLRPGGRTLSEVLCVEDGIDEFGVEDGVVADILASIALAEDRPAPSTGSDAALAVVAADGGFRLGVRLGAHRKSEAEFIGATARSRRRAQRLVELDEALTVLAETSRTAAGEAEAAREELAGLTAAARELPRPTPISTALRAVAETAGALRSHAESAARAEGELDQAVAEVTARDRAVRAVAAEHRTSRDPREIDALAAAIRHFETTGAGLLRLRGDLERARERDRESADRLTEARDLAEAFAEEAEAADSGYHEQARKLETLRAALGAGAADIDRDLEAARLRIETARAQQKAARKAANAAIEAVGDAEAAYRTAHDALATALTEIRAQAETLRPYARPDLLRLLGAPDGHRWPAADAAWSTPDQLLYRIARAEPDAPPSVLPEEVDALLADLVTATATARTGEAVRKSTRTAVTTALQDYDAALAAAGGEHRLHWDAADGVTVVGVQDEHGSCALADFADRVDRARQDQESLLTDAERRILEDALLTGLAQQIHERTGDARELIARMGSEMKKRRMSSGNTLGVHWVPADTLSDTARTICRLLDRDSAGLEAEDLAAIRAHFAAEIRAARAAHPERSYPEILALTLDYRRWRVFSFTLVSADGAEDKLTVARHSALSGGEQSVSLHLPLFAAAHVMLDSADPQAPRLLALDEAFAGVDDNGRSELLGLSVQFDLDLFMTGYDLWITYPHVPACAHYDLAHSAAEHTVSATLLVWDSADLLAEHDGTDLTGALGSPDRRRVPAGIEGGLSLDGMPGLPVPVG